MGRFISICMFATSLGITFGATPTGKLTFADGTEQTIQDPVPQLPSKELTDACVIGTFSTYDTLNFGFDGVQMIYWYYPTNDTGLNCWDDMFFKWSSARPIGSRIDTLTPFASLFSGRLLQDNEAIIAHEDGLANIAFTIGSVFLRKTSLQLFSEPNFGGEAFCVLDCGGLICAYNVNDIPGGGNSWDLVNAKSARLGCQSIENSVKSLKIDEDGQYFGYRVHTK